MLLEAISVSVEIDPATGADTLEIRDTRYFHPTEIEHDGPAEFYARSTDTKDIERMEFLESDNNVISDYGDYDPVEKYEQEVGLRPKTPLRLIPTAPPPPPKKKRRKAKQPSRAGRPPKWNWKKARIFAMGERKLRGSPRNETNKKEEWRADADLVNLVSDYFVNSTKNHSHPDEREIRRYVSTWIPDFEAGRN
jgi:hypothetical protein